MYPKENLLFLDPFISLKVENLAETRFSQHGSLYADLSVLDSKNFAEILKKTPSDALQYLGLSQKIDDTVTKEQLQTEVLYFAINSKQLSKIRIKEDNGFPLSDDFAHA
ncbi:hypothetical protein HELRODRAFT_178086 [Helobdella robusta]|uniref:Uncharacterized protein n=1 Tax=Helobdella robusta TaxID=6412 RepID=T1FCP7_HELRO|nr:hypothetical protein HELRODRAFT_178086 [Helobdella robusta]ESN97302.1 hypothetical protein HELRODRAFT_178086 [Helobdella robusta]